MRLLAPLLALALLAPAVPAAAYVPEQTPERSVERATRATLAHPATRGSTPGIVAMRGGVVVWSHNLRRPMVPASLMKLLTTTAAMVRFGPGHRFATRALAPRAGATVPVLYLVGGGDPTLATEAFRRHRFMPKPTDLIKRPAFASGSPTVEHLAAAIARTGVRRVTGRLVVDDSWLDDRRVQSGWLPRYLVGGPDVAYLSGLTINEGKADPDGKRLLRDPALAAGRELRRALAARGVRVDGGIVRGRAPRDAVEVGAVSSPPVEEIVDFINRYSINYEAELLLKNLGAAFGGVGSTEAGARVVRDVLQELDVPVEELRIEDGSGLSLLNRVTPHTLAVLLDRIATRRGAVFASLRATIPVAGQPGTLLHRMTRRPTGGNLRGKTGLLRGVRGMAGWVTARDGVPIVYVGLFNDARSASALTGPLNILGTLLALYPRA